MKIAGLPGLGSPAEDLLAEFRRACAENGTNPTAEIKKIIARYCEVAREKE